jgi:tuftelin-interacting protein 11
MTGKQTKVSQGYSSLSSKHMRPTEEGEEPQASSSDRKYFDMPELLHNLDLLCDMTEQEIIQNDRKLSYANDQIIHMKHEHERLDAVVLSEEKHFKSHKELLALIEEYEKKTKEDSTEPLTLDDLTLFFQRLQNEFYEEYRVYELSSLGYSLALPLVQRTWKMWDCLASPQLGFDTMKELQKMLEEPSTARYERNKSNSYHSGQNKQASLGQGAAVSAVTVRLFYFDALRRYTDGLNAEVMDPYHRILWEVWMPPVRTAILAGWDVRKPDSLINFIELWTPRIPGWILANILDSQVNVKNHKSQSIFHVSLRS